ncbi:conserved hypothetical protein [Methanocaldococcus vulcanius M7]|uniref:Endonuclease GajA/Old nuclease/RecF-like AAA domain-containing protein n=1 Tax=Methanocaldococcus vulcanius (strain ATCC 700851 / DSM 12094 / M7) TaxID=579137 RepID=C9RG07_METVM|nr:AAA family ATPase [Methanocaldococcus vulcanius]ACX72509.1 conserved hypothetical protein [Methanocaldococcus vulcanius M7]
MKITSVKAKNLLSFEDFEIEFGEGNVVIIFGPNNVGKTNLFRILKLLKNIINEKMTIQELELYLHDKQKKSMSIEIGVEFDNLDKNLISRFLKVFFKLYAPNLVKTCNNMNINIIDVIIDYFSSGSYIWECSQLNCHKPHFLVQLNNLERDIEEIKSYLKEKGYSTMIPDLIDHSKILQELDRNVEVISAINELKNIITSTINSIIDAYEKGGRIFFTTLIEGRNSAILIEKDKSYEEFNTAIGENIEKYGGYFKRLKMEYVFLKLFIVLIALKKLTANNMTISLKKVVEYSKENPWDDEILEDLKYIAEFFGYEITEMNDVSLNDILLKIYENGLIFYEDYLPNKGKVSIPDGMIVDLLASIENSTENSKMKSKILELFKNSTVNSMQLGLLTDDWVSSYLFFLKNNADIKLRKKFLKIKEMFEFMFNGGKLSFDVILDDNKPDIVIYSEEIEVPLNMAGLGVKKILEILTLIYGYDSKVVLLDAPFIQLYQKYQKRFSKIFRDIKNIESQTIIILHSLHFIDEKITSDIFRFYRPKKCTRYVHIGNTIKKLEKEINTKILDRTTRKMLLSDAVILLSSALRDLPLFDLADYFNIPMDEFNIEVVRPQNTLCFEKYYSLLQYTSIPYLIIVRSSILYNLYEPTEDGKYRLLEKGKFHKLVEERLKFFKTRHPFWLIKEEFDEVISQYIKTLETHREKLNELGYNYLSSEEDVAKYCINPLREKLDPLLRKKLFIFTVPHDFILPANENKDPQIKERYILHNYLAYKKETLEEFKEFFDYFIKFHNLQ